MTVETTFDMSDDILDRLGEEASDYALGHSDRWIEVQEWEYEIDLDLEEIIGYAASILLAQREIDAVQYDDICADCSWIADRPAVRRHLLWAVEEIITEIELEYGDDVIQGLTAEHFLP